MRLATIRTGSRNSWRALSVKEKSLRSASIRRRRRSARRTRPGSFHLTTRWGESVPLANAQFTDTLATQPTKTL